MKPLIQEPGTPTIADLAASIRRIRKNKGWTLKDVEDKSQGRWKAVVIGSYERCDRALSLNKAIALAAFYKVPLDELLGIQPAERLSPERITFDIRKVKESQEDSLKPLQWFITAVSEARRDWNGELLSVRSSDTLALSAAIHMPASRLKDALAAYGLTFIDSNLK
jgi:transcriptional regulator with XRE-family HTH domain